MKNTNDLQKLASQVPAILAESSKHLSKLASNNVKLSEENSVLRNELRLHKIARRMEDRGLESGLSFEQKIAHLHEVDSSKLDALEAAVELTHGGFKLGSLAEVDEPNNKGVVQEVGSATHFNTLDDFIMSGRALS